MTLAIRLVLWIFVPIGVSLIWSSRQIAEMLVRSKRTIGPVWLNQGLCILAGAFCIGAAIKFIVLS